MKCLFKFEWDCGRMGDVEGVFIATKEDVDNIIGKEIYFGEILGKHSEVFGDINKGDITQLDVSEITIKELEEVLGTSISGYNPLDYYEGE